MLDIPNARSSHQMPTPRGGGLAIVITTCVLYLVLALLGRISVELFLALSVGGVAVALVGFVDDRRPVSARTRLAVHFAAAVWAMVCLRGLPPLQIGFQVISFGWAGYVLGAVGVVWALNLFNFMDGIDGIAASEAMFVSLGAALLGLATGGSAGVIAAAVVLGSACFGFLLWNWPPARIFMGDVGSGYLGYIIAVLAVSAGREQPHAVLTWLILCGVFFVDATVTLLRRTSRRELVHEAHRSHAYQWLARRWGSHLTVSVAVNLLNVFFLLPCAYLASIYPRFAGWLLIGAFVPLVVLALAAGAGRAER